MSRLQEVIISITNRCNLRCKMCDIPEEKTEELTSLKWRQVIQDASSIGAQTIVFSGGEPLLRKDIFELILFVKKHGMMACLTSNGFLINEKIAWQLAQSKIDVVHISIEGPAEIHDSLRSNGTFDRAVSALENLKKYKIESTISTMISRYNYKYLPYIVGLAKRFEVATIKFQPFSEIFLNNKKEGNSFFISYKEIEELKRIIQKVISLCSSYDIATNPRNYLEKVPPYLARDSYALNGTCSALWRSCPINSRGEIYPCWVLIDKDKLVGSVKEERFTNLWNSQRHNSIIEQAKKNGCSGCMMSCYDESFGKDNVGRKIAVNIKRLKKQGVYRYIDRIFKRWQKRIRFYISYRGSLTRNYKKN